MGQKRRADRLALQRRSKPSAWPSTPPPWTPCDGAVDLKADFLLCHHPLTLAPRLPSRLDEFHEVLRLSLGTSMWVYSAHTSLDANPDGPVNWLGRALGLTNMRVNRSYIA